jgi:hypothetical protein
MTFFTKKTPKILSCHKRPQIAREILPQRQKPNKMILKQNTRTKQESSQNPTSNHIKKL